MAPNHGADTLVSICGPMGSHWVQKLVKNVKTYHAPKFQFFAKNRIYGYGAKSRCGHPRVHLGANGVPLGPKNGQNRKKLPCPKIRIFGYPAVIAFSQIIDVMVMAPNHGWDPLGSILGPMGSHWVKQWVKIVKNYHALNSNFWLPRGHLGANGVPFGPKNGSKPKKLPCPQIQIFCYPAVIVFSQKIEVTVMAPNQGGDPLGFILGPMVSHWVKKNGSKP